MHVVLKYQGIKGNCSCNFYYSIGTYLPIHTFLPTRHRNKICSSSLSYISNKILWSLADTSSPSRITQASRSSFQPAVLPVVCLGLDLFSHGLVSIYGGKSTFILWKCPNHWTRTPLSIKGILPDVELRALSTFSSFKFFAYFRRSLLRSTLSQRNWTESISVWYKNIFHKKTRTRDFIQHSSLWKQWNTHNHA